MDTHQRSEQTKQAVLRADIVIVFAWSSTKRKRRQKNLRGRTANAAPPAAPAAGRARVRGALESQVGRTHQNQNQMKIMQNHSLHRTWLLHAGAGN